VGGVAQRAERALLRVSHQRGLAAGHRARSHRPRAATQRLPAHLPPALCPRAHRYAHLRLRLRVPAARAAAGAVPLLRRCRQWGHAHRYANYLHAAHAADSCLARLWAYLQATPQYRDKTTLLITTDHGRGRGRWWYAHGPGVPGAGQTWLAVLGPDTPPTGEQRGRGQLYLKQVAQLLGVPYRGERPTGPAIEPALPDYAKAESR